MTLKCDNHPEREAWNCSTFAVKRYLCEECRGAYVSSAPSRFAREGRDPFGLMTPYNAQYGDTDTCGQPLYGPSSREELHKQHYIDRSKE